MHYCTHCANYLWRTLAALSELLHSIIILISFNRGAARGGGSYRAPVRLPQSVWAPSSASLLSLRHPTASVCSYYKQQRHSNLWLNINHRADQRISTPGIARKPQTDSKHQLLNIEVSMLSKQPFPDLSAFTEGVFDKHSDSLTLQLAL